MKASAPEQADSKKPLIRACGSIFQIIAKNRVNTLKPKGIPQLVYVWLTYGFEPAFARLNRER